MTTWTAPAVDRRADPMLGDERTVLDGWLDYHRETLQHKCSGLTAEQLKTASAPPSNLTLLGLVRHLAEIERWFRTLFTGEDFAVLYGTEDRPDAALDDVADADAEADFAMYRNEVELSRQASRLRGLDETFEEDGEKRNLRTIYVHLIEEYARHNGHADMLRERIDGVTGD